MADFKLDRIRFKWKNVWTSATAYTKDDVVYYQGSVYVCLTGHTSDPSFYIDSRDIIPKWEIMQRGAVWSGNWATNTYYDEHDIVKWKGYVYKCVFSHTSNAVLITGLTGDTIYWTLLATTNNWLNEWTILTYYELGDVVRYNGDVYVCNTKHQATTTNALGLEDDQSSWTLVTVSDFWKGNLTDGIRYRKDDIVRYNGNVYRCVTGHTSTLNIEDNIVNWEVVLTGLEYRQDYADETYYRIGDIVKYGPSLWKCITTHTSDGIELANDSQVANWELWLPGLSYESSWSSLVQYQQGDIVQYGGYIYTSLTNNINSVPSVNGILQDTGDWELLIASYKFQGEWSAATAYKTGDVVRNNGYVYVARTDHAAGIYPTSTVNWQILITGNQYIGNWFSTQLYYPGDIAVYAGTSYSAVQQHTGVNPKTDAAGVGANWVVIVGGSQDNVLADRGDIRTHDGSNVVDLDIGLSGTVLKVGPNGDAVSWLKQDFVDKVYYVSIEGVDGPNRGTTISAPFRTIKYACDYILANEALRAPATIFIKTGIYEEVLPISVPADVALVGDELRSTIVMPQIGHELADMFYVRNGSGIRNMTLQGLSGVLGATNEYLTRRPTAGAFVGLDPGTGPDDVSVHITSKSPYIQNVSTFGTACVGMRINGSLHNSGNKSIVANDFTQIIPDGIGYWASNNALSELVSVFTYYCHIGYLSTDGGRLRGTNGNNSYGTYGSVAEGFDSTEDPITALVNNRSKEATVAQVFTNTDALIALGYSHAGQEYSAAAAAVTGPGAGAAVEYNEFRKGSLSELRLTDPGDSSTAGGINYGQVVNYAQGGSPLGIRISVADTNTIATLEGLRIVITQGAGIGQYGIVTGFNPLSKDLVVSRESDGKQGWDHLYPGYPIAATLDQTTRYSIETRVSIDEPPFLVTNVLAPTIFGAIAWLGGNTWAGAQAGGTAGGLSTDGGTTWNSVSIPAGTWTNVATGGGTAVFLQSTQSTAVVIRTSNGSSWAEETLPAVNYWAAGAYSGTRIVLIAGGVNGTTSTAYSNDLGNNWLAGGALPSNNHRDVAYGNGKFIAIKYGSTWATSTDGTSWTTLTVPLSGNWNSITYGNNRFVAVQSGSDVRLYSFDGITWYRSEVDTDTAGAWSKVEYSQGTFAAITLTTNVVSMSPDGRIWSSEMEDSTIKTLFRSGAYSTFAAGESNIGPRFIANQSSQSNVDVLTTGAKPLVRAIIDSSRVKEFHIYEPGSGYTIENMGIALVDPNNTLDATFVPRINNGVLPQPKFTNRGHEYASAKVTITGDGFADSFQIGADLIVSNMIRLPGPGDNLVITGINDVTYRVVSFGSVTGSLGNYSAIIQLSPTLGRAESPEHNTGMIIRQRYSQVRLTGHDFLDIGTGNALETNYPGLYVVGYQGVNDPKPANEVQEAGGGRVFYTSTDQDGNFRVGELFEVQQRTGIVSINASYFELNGLTELTLGGIQVGGTAVVVREFSKDGAFIANSNNILPTQRAVKTYIESRLGGGTSNVSTNTLIAGEVQITGNTISTTGGSTIQVNRTINFKSGISGSMLARAMFK
tara:strand:+ start:2468 stop:7150 length:4683 start_codon:yes stop_codon:yes gene_type:complete